MMRRASVFTQLGPIDKCPRAGFLRIPLYKLEAMPSNLQGILSAAFQQDYPKWGTGPYDDQPAAVSLSIVLSGQGSGAYMRDGTLGQIAVPPVSKKFKSDLVPYLADIDPDAGLPQAALDKMVNGDLDSDKIYKGNLAGGFSAFLDALKKKLTYNVQPDAFARRILTGTTLKVPGVIVVDQTSPLEIGPVDKVEGGILIAKGPIHLKGNITRGGTAGAPGEPLTLVSLQGDILLDAAAQTVDAMLVAVNGKVKFAGDVTVSGVAGKNLDVTGLSAPGTRKIKFSEDMDPWGPNKTLLKVYYGGDDRVQVSGSGS